jgi:hypothetical protein
MQTQKTTNPRSNIPSELSAGAANSKSGARWVLLLLILGLVLQIVFLIFNNLGEIAGTPKIKHQWFGLLAGLIGFIPFISQKILRLHEQCSRSSSRLKIGSAICIGIISTSYLIQSAIWQDRGFDPHMHDEFTYLLQARILSEGKLWMPSHALPEFWPEDRIVSRSHDGHSLRNWQWPVFPAHCRIVQYFNCICGPDCIAFSQLL